MDEDSRKQFVSNLLGFVEEATHQIFQIEMMAEQENKYGQSTIANSIVGNLNKFIEGTKAVYGIK